MNRDISERLGIGTQTVEVNVTTYGVPGKNEEPALSACRRCGGLMIREALRGGGAGVPRWELTVWRCVMCGDSVDPVIMDHRDRCAGRTERGRSRAIVSAGDRSELDELSRALRLPNPPSIVQ